MGGAYSLLSTCYLGCCAACWNSGSWRRGSNPQEVENLEAVADEKKDNLHTRDY